MFIILRPFLFLLLAAPLLIVASCSREQFGATGDRALETFGLDTEFEVLRLGPGRFDIIYDRSRTSKGRVLTVAKEECPGQFNSAVLVKAHIKEPRVRAEFQCTKKVPQPTQEGRMQQVELKEDAFGRFFVFFDRRIHTYGDAKQKAFFYCQAQGRRAQIVRPPAAFNGTTMRATFICR